MWDECCAVKLGYKHASLIVIFITAHQVVNPPAPGFLHSLDLVPSMIQ